ncbi:MAG: hypothetical protein ACT4P2_11735 [Pseudomonadota bacterium]
MLTIEADWEVLGRGTPEERACFAALGLRYGNVWLTQAEDAFVNRVRNKVHLSAYRLAEWFAWNWWRLRWEPRTQAPDWALAHRMTTIGGGYVWPNITVFSDGERIVLLTKPTRRRAQESLHYILDLPVVVRAGAFEDAVDGFIDQVCGQLRAEQVLETNLDRIWTDVRAERLDRNVAIRRRFEALLGFDPDEATAQVIEGLVGDAASVGECAMTEIAADHTPDGNVLTAAALQQLATDCGLEAFPRDAVRLKPHIVLPPTGEVPAWQRGAKAARALREQEGLGAGPIDNARLAEMAGVSGSAMTVREGGTTLSFALDENMSVGRVVLRSKWETGRRFDLARLLGDRIAGGQGGKLFPATRADTYRQKVQRSFAAELLSPFEAVDEMLGGDISGEKQQEAAKHYNVSERTIWTLLVNHGRIDRDELDVETVAAA